MQRIKKCLSCIYIGLLLAIFGGFTWMHYSTVKSAPSVWGNLPETIIGATVSGDNSTAISPSPNTSNRTISKMDIFQAMLSDNERATTRVFALVTVLIAAATLIVALQFFVNHQMLTELEEKRKKFDDEFKKKESKLYRIENAVKKVESLAQATSYPLRISMTNIDNEEFCKHQDIGRFIQYSFNGFDKDNRKDSADWNIILFLAQQALASMESENDEFKTKFRRLLAVAACMSEGRTSDREEKYILLKLAIETFNSMETKELCDKVNLASAYARRGMLYASLPKSADYEQADRLFGDITKEELFEKQADNLKLDCFFNWGISWLARASIFKQETEEWKKNSSFREAKNCTEKCLEKANSVSGDQNIADYALLSLYSISENKERCETIIEHLEDKFQKTDQQIPLPPLHRIYEDIDFGFIHEKDKELYEKLADLARKNEARDRKNETRA